MKLIFRVGLIFLIYLIACSENYEGNKSTLTTEGSNKTSVDYTPLKRRRIEGVEKYIHPDSIYIYFEQGFTADLIELEVNDFKAKQIISTTESIDFAARFVFPNMRKEKLYIKKNHTDLLIIDLKKAITNKWAINFYQDTMYAKSLPYAPTYE
ncbi:hypothetical protein GXP67_18400 [Rhodocytophaga rosea]|uniref:Uncharacterized protein n=1 Tax=Rhodocytophaga rosea TaxID=2704465 RepID=A0A6C0GLG8_9BACT|nr:hypothetical protein [Rhodocytophaga rosea]QHT68472.1 hypothetical protein GXP67_18400 [Rhodocytophaga rosea]